jgi:isopenicillin N synthase-like dioxygenase
VKNATPIPEDNVTRQIPAINFARWKHGSATERADVARDVDTALHTIGFLLLEDTGIDVSLVDQVRSNAIEFFGLPVETKTPYAALAGGRSWIPLGTEANAYSLGQESPPDLKEAFQIGHADVPGLPVNVWPTLVPGLRQPAEDYIALSSTSSTSTPMSRSSPYR